VIFAGQGTAVEWPTNHPDLPRSSFLTLPAGEDLFVHSYAGRRYLYPAPAPFVNHADDPSCYQDFDRGCDIALRPIARGEPVTIDTTAETAREFDTFLDAYQQALRARSAELPRHPHRP
jgi:hypothetical protein